MKLNFFLSFIEVLLLISGCEFSAIPNLVSYDTFVNSLSHGRCKIPKMITSDMTEIAPITVCNSHSKSTEREALCLEISEVLKNITRFCNTEGYPKVDSDFEILVPLAFDVCDDFKTLKPIISIEHSFLGKSIANDDTICNILCHEKSEHETCQYLLWSYKVEAIFYGKAGQYIELLDAFSMNASTVAGFNKVPLDDVPPIENAKKSETDSQANLEILSSNQLQSSTLKNLTVFKTTTETSSKQNESFIFESFTKKTQDMLENNDQLVIHSNESNTIDHTTNSLKVDSEKRKAEHVTLSVNPMKDMGVVLKHSKEHHDKKNTPHLINYEKTGDSVPNVMIVTTIAAVNQNESQHDQNTRKLKDDNSNENISIVKGNKTLTSSAQFETTLKSVTEEPQKEVFLDDTSHEGLEFIYPNEDGNKDYNVTVHLVALDNIKETTKSDVQQTVEVLSTLDAPLENMEDSNNEHHYKEDKLDYMDGNMDDEISSDYSSSDYDNTAHNLDGQGEGKARSSDIIKLDNTSTNEDGEIELIHEPRLLKPIDKLPEIISDTEIMNQMSESFPDQEDNHFFFYFLTIVAVIVSGYLLYTNKQKIIALIVEGRHERRRRPHGVNYKKLETN